MLKNFILKIIHKLDPKDRAYVSEADQFLQKFDRDHPPAPSQVNEFKRHQDIFNRKSSNKIKW